MGNENDWNEYKILLLNNLNDEKEFRRDVLNMLNKLATKDEIKEVETKLEKRIKTLEFKQDTQDRVNAKNEGSNETKTKAWAKVATISTMIGTVIGIIAGKIL